VKIHATCLHIVQKAILPTKNTKRLETDYSTATIDRLPSLKSLLVDMIVTTPK